MKIILLKDVPKLGRKYDVKDVSDGHAQNFLIPRGLVAPATTQMVQKINQQKEKNDAEKKIQADLLFKNLDTIKKTTVTIKSKANEKGHLFAGVNKDDLIAEIFKQTHMNLDPETIILEKPIKEVGQHKVTIEALGKKADMTVVVEAE